MAKPSKTGFPQVFGAINACHIAVRVPKAGLRDYINFFIRSLQIMSDAFYKSSFFLNDSKLLYGGDRIQYQA